MTIELNLRPRPVSVTTPTMIPAAAQVAATARTPTEPARSAWAIRVCCSGRPGPGMKPSAVSFRRNERAAAAIVAQNTAVMALNPSSMKTTTATSEVKWNPRSRIIRQTLSRGRSATSFVPSLRASSSTIRNRPR